MLLAKAKTVLVRKSRIIAKLLKPFEGRYEPSKHYMRGPGPKAKAAAARETYSGSEPSGRKASAST
jgi:hypothetical protein